MKKYIFVSTFLVFFALILVPLSSVSAYIFIKPLDMSSTGVDVKELQAILKSEGYFTGAISGIYGATTVKAVRLFQSNRGLDIVGVVGPKTIEKLNTASQVLGASLAMPPFITESVAAPSISSLSPSQGPVGTTVTIRGTGFTPTGNRIKFGSLGSENNPTYSVNSPDGQTLIFTVPESNYFTCWYTNPNCAIRAIIITQPGDYGVSVINANGTSNEINFKVTSGVSSVPSITVLSPNGGEVYQAGQQITVTWKAENIPVGYNLSIVLDDRRSNSIGGIILGSNLRNDGTEVVTLPTSSTWNNMAYGTFYQIRVAFSEVSGGPFDLADESDNLFTINSSILTTCSSTSVPSITVLSPNGGEIYKAGQQITVKWDTCNIPSEMNALIILNDEINGIGGDLVVNTPNDGIEVVTLPTQNTWGVTNTFGGTFYKARVSFTPFGGYDGKQLSDASDGLFTIETPVLNSCGSTTTPWIKVVSPNGGEVYQAGQQITVKWEKCNIIADIVGIFIYDKNSGKETEIVYPTPNDGSEIINLPTQAQIPEMQYGRNFKMEISNDQTGGDLSDNLFTINAPSTTLDPTPRIAYWYGKVNQHVDAQGNWVTDQDGGSGANIDKLTYCKKWYPGTTKVEPYKMETITTWKRAIGYEQGNYTNTVMTDKCVQGIISQPSIRISGASGSQVSDSLINVNVGDVFTISGIPQGLQGLSYWTGAGYPPSGYYNMAYVFDQAFGNSNLCGNNLSTNSGPWTMTCTAKVSGSSEFYLNIFTNGQVYRSNTVTVNINKPTIECTPTSTPSVTVLSPNGGEVYQAGQQITAKWETCNTMANDQVMIILKSIKTAFGAEITTVPNTGVATVTLPTTLGGGQFSVTPGKYYKIRTELGGNSTGGGNVPSDESDTTFTIKKFKILSPEDTDCSGTKYNTSTGDLCPPPLIEDIKSVDSVGGSTAPFVFKRTLKVGVRGDDVAVIQRMLLSEGAYNGPITGYFGAMTREAVRKFQAQNGLPVLGIVGPKTTKALTQ